MPDLIRHPLRIYDWIGAEASFNVQLPPE